MPRITRMRWRLFGRTGLRVSELCLGTMTFGEDWGWGAPKEECARILDAFGAAGGNFVDTADGYTNGSSERILGELIRPERDRWVLATKYAASSDPDDPNAGGTHRKNLTRALEASLRRLGTDRIDVYWVHIWDVFTPIDEVVRALDDLVAAGKILYVGLSDAPAWVTSQAVTLAELRGWTRFAGVQVPYSLVRRDVERDTLPMAAALELSVTAWEPLGGGLLTGRYGTDRELPAGTRIAAGGGYAERVSERNLAIADELNAVAAARGASPAQVAIAWAAAHRSGAVIPVIGARRAEQIADSVGAAGLLLDPEERRRLDAVSAVDLGFPHDFEGRDVAYGRTGPAIDTRRPQPYDGTTQSPWGG